MEFTLEKIDLSKVKQLYFARGYKDTNQDHYTLSLVLVGDKKQEFEVCLFSSQETLTITEWKELMKAAKETGLKLCAKTLKADFDKFYNNRAFERIKL